MTERERFAAEFDVSRETLKRLQDYADLLLQWQAHTNLVGPGTMPQLWTRHFFDSAQLLPIAGAGHSWLDMGAGAGFPGLVLAVLDPAARLTLVESIAKKCRFLGEAAALLGVADRIVIANQRIETLPRQRFDIITARALASLDKLFAWGIPFAAADTRWVLPKGARAEEELASASKQFHFVHELIPSRTDSQARIIVASAVRPR